MSWPLDILAALPNRDKAPPMQIVDAATLTPERFVREFVDQMRPCLVRGAVRSWPAFERWGDPSYLQRALAGATIDRVQNEPTIEFPWRPRIWSKFEQVYADAKTRRRRLPADTFFDRIATGEFLFCYARELPREGDLSPIFGDVGELPFVPPPRLAKPPRMYPQYRLFFHGRSYTDWHAHRGDETLMCQLGTAKRVALLGPGQKVFDAMMEVFANENFNRFDVERYPKLAELAPQVFTVEPGDATYLPPFTWHAVETIGEPKACGATLAVCWACEDRITLDPRFAFQKFNHQNIWDEPTRKMFEERCETVWRPMHDRGFALPATLME